jgi:SulP family sulfate permease
LLVPRFTRLVPAPLVALTAVGAAAWALALPVATLGTRFQTEVGGHTFAGIPPFPPAFHLPWGEHRLTLHFLRTLMPAAFAIALLGAIESLLSAVVADGMTGKRHDPDAELVGQGLANLVTPFFGGIAATGALARTATGIRAGARSPISGVVHAAVVLVSMVLLAPLVGYVPMAALAALLLVVAWNMAELRHFTRILRVGPRSDVFVLVTCYGLTVAFDMVIAVSVGVVLAALLFMNRMAELTRSRVFQAIGEDETSWLVPRGVAVYEIAGALFFGAAEHAMGAMSVIARDVKVVVLGLGRVPVIDATGLVALESALDRLRRDKRFVIIAGPLPEPRRIFEKAELEANLEHVLFADDMEQGLEIARDLLALNPGWISAGGPGHAPRS